MVTVLLNPKKLHENLDPKEIPYTNDFYLLENLISRLFVVDEEGNYQLQLASKVEKISDTSYDIEIKESYFSNGDQITSNDIKSSFERAMRLGSSHVQVSALIDKVQIINDKKLRIHLKNKIKSFSYLLSLPDLGILHHSLAEKEQLVANDFTSITSGPFYYKSEDGNFYLVKNPGYKLSAPTYPDKIKLLSYFQTEPQNLLLNGDADLGKISVNFFLENLKRFQEQSSLRTIGVPSSSLAYLYFNENSSSFKNPVHRKWFKQIIQKNFKISSDLQWFAKPSMQYFPPESRAYLTPNEIQKELSKSLQIEKPKDFPKSVTIHTYTTAFNVTVKSLLDQLTTLPEIKIIIVNDVLPSEYISKMEKGEFDIFLNIMSSDFKTSVESINFEFFSKHHALIDKTGEVRKNYHIYQTSFEHDEEIRALKEVSKSIFHSDQIIPLYHSAIPYVFNSDKIDFGGLNHAFVFNLWRIKAR